MFETLNEIPLDRVFQLFEEYKRNENPKKINLGIGLYADELGRSFVFPSVKQAFMEVDVGNFNYQPLEGIPDFLRYSTELVFGKESFDNLSAQAVCGGTHACKLFSELLGQEALGTTMMIGTPTWSNHYAIFRKFQQKQFRHLDELGNVDLQSYIRVLEEAAEYDVLLIQGAQTHNPCGVNLSIAQLETIKEIINKKNIRVLMDMAYLGLGEGIEKDAEYAKWGLENIKHFACTFSYSKNASLYEHRTGLLFVKTEQKQAVSSQMRQLCREAISNPPGIGQEIMINILGKNRSKWLEELETVRNDIISRKRMLIEQLGADFEYLLKTSGMFGMLKVSPEQVNNLRENKDVYLLDSGRINFSGIKPSDIEYLAASIKSVM